VDFTAKKIVITGCGPDFGRTLSVCFARLGCELFLSARTLEKAEETARIVRSVAPDVKTHCFKADIARAADTEALAQAVGEISPSVDVLINNASAWLQGDFTAAGDEQIIEAINSTFTGAVLTTKHFMPLLERSAAPDIVFINGTPSLSDARHRTAHVAFGAAKAAQAAFADRLRYRTRGSGLRVITIVPPNFTNTSPLDEQKWNERRPAGKKEEDCLTARNVFECVRFALQQDRICCIDQIVMSNNSPGGGGT
jgi:NADP-dependent 3-hydroxy acid dehydrogenase YdfG